MSLETFAAQVAHLCSGGLDLCLPPIAKYLKVSVVAEKVRYTRGHSTMRVALTDLYETWSSFRGRRVSSTDLRAFRPHVFDSSARPSGHSCNVGLLFSLLIELRLADDLRGAGVRGNPFSIEFRS